MQQGIGVDEAGRGPLLGRVYAAAVVLPSTDEPWMMYIKDSKRFGGKNKAVKIREVADQIRQNAVAYGVAWRDEKRIDDINILQATQETMHDAISQCLRNMENHSSVKLWVDGNYFRPFPGVVHECVEQGDDKVKCIAAASILAKVARDDYILALCEEYPELVDKYDLAQNKGYGTKRHMEGIRIHGLCEWHRRSFRSG